MNVQKWKLVLLRLAMLSHDRWTCDKALRNGHLVSIIWLDTAVGYRIDDQNHQSAGPYNHRRLRFDFELWTSDKEQLSNIEAPNSFTRTVIFMTIKVSLQEQFTTHDDSMLLLLSPALTMGQILTYLRSFCWRCLRVLKHQMWMSILPIIVRLCQQKVQNH